MLNSHWLPPTHNHSLCTCAYQPLFLVAFQHNPCRLVCTRSYPLHYDIKLHHMLTIVGTLCQECVCWVPKVMLTVTPGTRLCLCVRWLVWVMPKNNAKLGLIRRHVKRMGKGWQRPMRIEHCCSCYCWSILLASEYYIKSLKYIYKIGYALLT